MPNKEYGIIIEGQKIIINFIDKVMNSLTEMCLNEYPIYGTILSLGKDLLTMRDQQQFVIIDEFQKLGIVGIKDMDTMAVDIIAIVPQEYIFIKRATKVFRYGISDTISNEN